jgi:hypothetical protein
LEATVQLDSRKDRVSKVHQRRRIDALLNDRRGILAVEIPGKIPRRLQLLRLDLAEALMIGQADQAIRHTDIQRGAFPEVQLTATHEKLADLLELRSAISCS